MNVMVENLDAIRPWESGELELDNEALDMLLFDFLQELIYYKDSERLLLRVPYVKIQKGGREHTLSVRAQGEVLDPDRHLQRVDVKAVTLHRFSLVSTEQGWRASVILDI